jgi:hypothetical protein
VEAERQHKFAEDINATKLILDGVRTPGTFFEEVQEYFNSPVEGKGGPGFSPYVSYTSVFKP